MTMTKGTPERGTGPDMGRSGAPAEAGTSTRPARRSHVPADGSAAARAVEEARSAMLHEVKPRKRTRIGADVLCEALLRQGVDVFFSYPGGVILPLYDILGDYPELRHILVRHEQGGAHAADGYARVTGRVGVCMGTSGPGATNLVTGIGTALLDSVPVVAITGNVPAALLGKDAFQEIDITGITLPITKHNYLVRDADDIPRVVAEAFHIARTGRPGPVHIDITKDALQQETAATHPSQVEIEAGLPGFRPTFDGHPKQLKLAAAEIAGAKRPVILAGHGVLHARAWDDLRAFAEKTSIPVAWTLLGIGAMDETHPLAYGYMGMHGWKHVNRAIQSADLLIALGMRFDDRVTGNVRTYAPYARIVHVDIDPAEIGKNVAVEVPIVGDAGRVLRDLLPMVERTEPAERADYLAQLAEWKVESVGSSWHGSGAWREGLLTADYVVERIGELTEHRATYVADVGQNQMWLARYTGFSRAQQPRQLGWPGHDGLRRPGRDGRRPRPAGPGDLGDHRRRRVPDDLPGADDPGPGPHPGEDRPARQQEARDDPPVAGDHLRGQLPLVPPDGPGLRQARRGVRDPGLPGPDPGRGRRRHPLGPGGRRPGPGLVRDRRGAERLPDDARREGPVGPHRALGRGGRMSDETTAATSPAPPPRALPGTGAQHRHVLVVLVLDKPGVLNRVSSLMRARNFNIESLAVSHTDKPDISRMTIVIHGDDVLVEQAIKQLYRLIDVLKVQDFTAEPTVEHELALVKVRATDANRSEIVKIVELYRARVVDVSDAAVVVEATGSEAEVDALVALLRGFGIKELVRTGTVVMARGPRSIEEAIKR